jgi:hypothetical protein
MKDQSIFFLLFTSLTLWACGGTSDVANQSTPSGDVYGLRGSIMPIDDPAPGEGGGPILPPGETGPMPPPVMPVSPPECEGLPVMTNDIQARIDAAPDFGFVTLQGGCYFLYTSITISKDLSLSGAGPDSTLLISAVPYAASILIKDYPPGSPIRFMGPQFTLKNIRIKGGTGPQTRGIQTEWQGFKDRTITLDRVVLGPNLVTGVETCARKVRILNSTIAKIAGQALYISSVCGGDSGIAQATISRSIIASNDWGVWINGPNLVQVNMDHSDVGKNERGNFYQLADPTGKNGNLSVDPLFKDDQFHMFRSSPAHDMGAYAELSGGGGGRLPSLVPVDSSGGPN